MIFLTRRRVRRRGDARLADRPERDGGQRPDREGQPEDVRQDDDPQRERRRPVRSDFYKRPQSLSPIG